MIAKTIIQTVRGTHDILPEDQKYWRFIGRTVGRIMELAGFSRIDAPMMENTNLFFRAVGEATDIVEKEMYTFSMKGDDEKSLTLRPEGTAGVVRSYIEQGMHTWPQPVQLYYLGRMFRHDKPQAGRFREFSQFGYEIFGDADPVVDASTISLAWEIYEKLGLKNLILEINSIGCAEDRARMKKLILEYYKGREKRLCEACKKRIKKNPLRVLDCKEEKCQALISGAPQLIDNLCEACATHFRQVLEYLDELEIPYDLNSRLVRGLDYYTRTVFEIVNGTDRRQSALGGGGRYDLLVEQLGGAPTPAVGFAGGIERVILEMKRQGVKIEMESEPVQMYVISLGDLAKKKALKIVRGLRSAGFGAGAILGKDSLRGQLRSADRLGVPFSLIIGQREALADSVLIRNMRDGTQETVETDGLVKRITQIIAEQEVKVKPFIIPESERIAEILPEKREEVMAEPQSLEAERKEIVRKAREAVFAKPKAKLKPKTKAKLKVAIKRSRKTQKIKPKKKVIKKKTKKVSKRRPSGKKVKTKKRKK